MTADHGTAPGTESSPAFWRRMAGWLARQELWLTLPLVAVLAFPNPLSPWAVLGIPLLWLCRWAGRGAITRRTPVDLPILVLLTTMLVGLWASVDLDRSWPVVYQMVAQVALFYALVNVARSTRWLMLLAGALVLVTLLLAVFNLVEVFVLDARVFSEQALEGKGLIGLPKRNVVGGTLALLLPISLSLGFSRTTTWRVRVLLGLVTLLAGVSLFLAQTRGAWLALAIATLIVAIWHDRRFAVLIPVCLAGLALLTWYMGPEQMIESVLALDVTNSAQGRWELWQRSVYMIQDFPFTGVGLGTFGLVGKLLYPLFTFPEYPDHAHNIYFQTAVDQGLPGLVAFVALFMLLAWAVVQVIRRTRDPMQRALALGLLGTLVVYLLHGVVDCITAYSRASVVVWATMGVLMALWLFTRESARREFGD